MSELIMVTGGAGYIGSHVVKLLLEKGKRVFVLDDMSAGHAQVIEFMLKKFGEGKFSFADADLLDPGEVKRAVSDAAGTGKISGIIDFAAKIAVGESQQKPMDYFMTNVVGFKNLLLATDSIPLVKSCTAAAYGSPSQEDIPLKESLIPAIVKTNKFTKSQLMPAAVAFDIILEWYKKEVSAEYPFFRLDSEDIKYLFIPSNVYGVTKVMCELMLKKHEKEAGRKHAALRYFNAAGADPGALIGEDHNPETHLIPLVLKAAQGKVECINVFGGDYDTIDGTCVRDYISVLDLADAHAIMLDHLIKGGESKTYNLGTNKGYTVKQIIDISKKITGLEIPVKISGRREGDPPSLVADASLIRKEQKWKAKRSIDEIISSAWKWHDTHPDGYQ